MWQQFLTFIQTQQGMGVAGLVAIGLYLLYANGKLNFVTQYLPNWAGGTGGSSDNTTPNRGTVWDNLQYNYDYFKSISCADGMALTEKTSQHVFHEATPIADAQAKNVTALVQAVSDALNKAETPAPTITAPQQ